MAFYLYYRWFKKYCYADWLLLRNKARLKGQDLEQVVRDYILRELFLIDAPAALLGVLLVF